MVISATKDEPTGPVQPKPAKGNAPEVPPVARREHHDFLPVWLLIAIFAVVEVVIIWLMYPKWNREWDRFQIVRLQAKGQYSAALPITERLVARNPNDANLQYSYGYLLMRQERYKDALDAFLKARENRESLQSKEDVVVDIPTFAGEIGAMYFKLNDIPNAEKYLLEALEHNRMDARAAFNLGELEFQRKNYQKASFYFRTAINDPVYASKVKEYFKRMEAELFKGI